MEQYYPTSRSQCLPVEIAGLGLTADTRQLTAYRNLELVLGLLNKTRSRENQSDSRILQLHTLRICKS